MTKIAVIGTGYVGLVSSVGLAELGHRVIGVDIVEDKVQRLSSGNPLIFEEDLEEMLHKNLAAERLTFTTDAGDAVRQSNIVFICVGTPSRPDGTANVAMVDAAFQTVLSNTTETKLVVIKSTVPVGTNRRLLGMSSEQGMQDLIDLVANPEFLREGRAVYDFFHSDRIIIGSTRTQAAEQLKTVYSGLQSQVMVTDPTSAELIKYASNCFLATKISFANFVADLCEQVGADVTQVTRGMGLDQRIGPNFLAAGLGYGGSCFPKDIRALIQIARGHGLSPVLLESVQQVNEGRVDWALAQLQHQLGDLKGKRVCLLGAAFKPFTDDVREAPALKLAERIVEMGGSVSVCDPKAVENAKKQVPPGAQVFYFAEPLAAARAAHAIVLATEWPEFVRLDLRALREVMKQPVLVDGRNAWRPEEAREAGFAYCGVGRP